jgi:murein tripeptide amidase MpaA
MEGLI